MLNKKTRNLLGFLMIWVGLMLGPTQIVGFGQTSGPATNIRVFASDPTGNACSQTSVGLYGGALYTCQAGVYASIGGGGSFSTPVIITSTSNPCFAVGPNGSTNPTLAVKCDVASAITGVLVTGRATGGGVDINATGGTNESIRITPKGTGGVHFPNGTAGNPSISFTNNTTSGWYRSGNFDIRFSNSGTDLLGFSSSQKVVSFNNLVFSSSQDVGIYRNASGVAEINNGTAGTFADLKVRTYLADKTITAGGTTGAQTINKSLGCVNFAASATSLVVTNSLATANSIIIPSVGTDDTTMKSVSWTTTSGSFTLIADVAPTGEVKVCYLLMN